MKSFAQKILLGAVVFVFATVFFLHGCGGGRVAESVAPTSEVTTTSDLTMQTLQGAEQEEGGTLTVSGRVVADESGTPASVSEAVVYAFATTTPLTDLVPNQDAPHATVGENGILTINGLNDVKYILVIDYNADGVADERVFRTGEPGLSGVSACADCQEGDLRVVSTGTAGAPWCDASLFQMSFYTDNIVIAKTWVFGYNPDPTPFKCGLKMILRTSGVDTTEGVSDFNDPTTYVEIPAGSTYNAQLNFAFPAETTNNLNESHALIHGLEDLSLYYRALTINAAGTTIARDDLHYGVGAWGCPHTGCN